MYKLLKIFIERVVKNQFFAGSLIMILGTNLYNFGQFAFHIIAGRYLGTTYYGDMAALLNILGVFALVQISLGLTVVKFIASEKDTQKIKGITFWALKWSGVMGASVALLIIIFAFPMSKFLQLSQVSAVYLLAPIIAVYAMTSIIRSALQGLLRFGWFISSMLSEIVLKLILVLPFILAGYAVVGTMAALLIGVLGSFLIGILALRRFITKDIAISPKVSPLVKYSIPAFIQGVALTSMYSTDLLLVKHFFEPDQAGVYAALAKLGSIVFFGASPISHVMFPLVARKHSHGEPYHKFLFLSLILVSLMSVFLIILYKLFPSFFLSVLGNHFISGSVHLWLFGIFMGLLAVAMLFIQFYLSIGKVLVVGMFFIAAIVQGTLIWFFHGSIQTVIQMSIISAALLVFALSIYFRYHDRK